MSATTPEGSVSFNGKNEVTRIRFTVDGDPAPQGSKRHVGGGVMVEASKKARPWRAEMIDAIQQLDGVPAPLLGPLHVDLLFRFRHLASHYGTGRNAARLKDSSPAWKATYPDIDKLARTALDALVISGLIRDDGQVAVLVCEKRYALKPGLVVEVRPLS